MQRWALVAASLLVLSLVVTKVRNSAATGPPALLCLNRASYSKRANFAAQLAEGFGTGI